MLSRFGIQNFKCFGERTAFMELAPVTLLFGPNSSGKSAILDALMLLRQTWEHSLAFESLHMIGERVDLGSFINALHRRKDGGKPPTTMAFTLQTDRLNGWSVELEYGAEDDPDSPHLGKLLQMRLIGPHWTLTLEPRWEWEEKSGGSARELVVFRAADPDGLNSAVRLLAEHPVDGTAGYLLNELKGHPEHEWFAEIRTWRDRGETFREVVLSRRSLELVPAPSPARPEEDDPVPQPLRPEIQTRVYTRHRTDDALASEELLADVDRVLALLESRFDLHRDVGAELTLMFRVGPLRPPGARLYHDDSSVEDVGKDGQTAIQVLINRSETLLEPLNADLQALGVPYQLKLGRHRIKPGLSAVTVLVREEPKERGAGREMFLPDVGFGISQVIPVLLQRRIQEHEDPALRGTLLVQQPELHLHPAWQAELAELFVTPLKAQHPQDRQPSTFLLIETHSEHLVLRLQRMVRGKRLSAEVIAFVVIEVFDDGEPRVNTITLAEDGRFGAPWPKGFFPERRNELR